MSMTFANSAEAAKRKAVRDAIRKGDFTKSERDIITAIVNLWFHHKSSAEPVIYPRRAKLCKMTKTAPRTVSRCLAMLRDAGVIVGGQDVKRGRYVAASYTLNLFPLFQLCGCDIPDVYMGSLVEVSNLKNGTRNVSSTVCQNGTPYIYNVRSPSQAEEFRSRPSLRLIVGGAK